MASWDCLQNQAIDSDIEIVYNMFIDLVCNVNFHLHTDTTVINLFGFCSFGAWNSNIFWPKIITIFHVYGYSLLINLNTVSSSSK